MKPSLLKSGSISLPRHYQQDAIADSDPGITTPPLPWMCLVSQRGPALAKPLITMVRGHESEQVKPDKPEGPGLN